MKIVYTGPYDEAYVAKLKLKVKKGDVLDLSQRDSEILLTYEGFEALNEKKKTKKKRGGRKKWPMNI